MKETTRLVIHILAIAALGVGLWALLHFTAPKRQSRGQSTNSLSNFTNSTNDELWAQAVEKVKADRGDAANTKAAAEVPPELRHYEDRHWFLATQVAEVHQHNIQTCQDFVDLAAMIQRGEMVPVPAVTDTYILFGVGAKADDGVFTRWVGDQNIELHDDAKLRDTYARLDSARTNLQAEISGLQKQLGALKKGNPA